MTRARAIATVVALAAVVAVAILAWPETPSSRPAADRDAVHAAPVAGLEPRTDSAGGAPPSPASRAPVSVHGSVFRDGQPVPARVEARPVAARDPTQPAPRASAALGDFLPALPGAPRDGPAAVTRAGAYGTYEFHGLPPGLHSIEATTDDGLTGRALAVAPVEGDPPSVSIEVRAATASLRGCVLSSGDAPWRGTVVAVPWPPTDPLVAFSRLALARTGDDGRFTLEGLAEGAVVVGAMRDGTLLALGPPVTLPSAAEYVLRLDGGQFRVSGRVVADADGSPVAGAAVQAVFRPGRPAPDVVIGRAVTGADGRFSVVAPPEGSLRVTARGFAPDEADIAEDGAEIEIRLARGATVSGTVTLEEDGAPVAGVTVRALPDDYYASLLASGSAVTDAAGRYAIADLPAGSATVYVFENGWVSRGLADTLRRYGPLSIEVRSEPPATLDLVLERTARIEGTVLDTSGKPLAGALVSGLRRPRRHHVLPQWTEGLRAVSDDDGRFTFDHLAPGTSYVLSATKGESTATSAEVVKVLPGETSTVVLRALLGGQLDVQVVEAGSASRPIVGATVVASVEDVSETKPTKTDTDGWARFDPAPPGTSLVRARAAGWLPSGEIPVRFGEGAASAPVRVRIALSRGLSMSGRVRMPDGSPAPGAQIRVGSTFGALDAIAGPDGTFLVSGLVPGATDVLAGLKRGGKAFVGRVWVDAGASEVEIGLQPMKAPRVVRVRVQDLAGKPVPGIVLSTCRERFGWWNEIVDPERQDVGPGEWLLQASEGDRWIAASDPEDEDGTPLPLAWALGGPLEEKSTEVTIRLPAEAVIEGRVLGPDGRGIARVRVDACPFSSESGGRSEIDNWSSHGETDAEGAFRLGNLDAGEYEVSVDAPKGLLAPPAAHVASGRRDVEFRLAKGHRVRGVVRDPAGRPVPRAMAFRRGQGDGGDDWEEAEADDAGAFVLDEIPAGPVVLRAAPPGGNPEEAAASEKTVAQGAVDVVLVVDPGVDLVVRLGGADDAARRADALLILEDAGPEPPVRRARRVGGIARFEHLTRGRTYEFWAGPRRDGACAYRSGIRADAGEVTVSFGTGLGVSGRLILPPDSPLGLTVFARSRGAIFAPATVEASGKYVISGLPPGRCSLTARGLVAGTVWEYEGEANAGDTLDIELKPR